MINCEHMIVQCVGSIFFSSGILTNYDNDDDEQTIPLLKYLYQYLPPLFTFCLAVMGFPLCRTLHI